MPRAAERAGRCVLTEVAAASHAGVTTTEHGRGATKEATEESVVCYLQCMFRSLRSQGVCGCIRRAHSLRRRLSGNAPAAARREPTWPGVAVSVYNYTGWSAGSSCRSSRGRRSTCTPCSRTASTTGTPCPWCTSGTRRSEDRRAALATKGSRTASERQGAAHSLTLQKPSLAKQSHVWSGLSVMFLPGQQAFGGR